MRVAWTDPETGYRGFAVIDRLKDGFAGGGIRMRPGLTMQEVEGLARTMSIKRGAVRVRGGGAKGGVDCDPRVPEALPVLRRYVGAMAPLIRAYWSTGEDLGVSQEVLDEIFDDLGLGLTTQTAVDHAPDPARAMQSMARAKNARTDGMLVQDCVGGYGVAVAVAHAADSLGLRADQTRAVVQGFGSIGGATAKYLAARGMTIVGIADRLGTVVNQNGLDVGSLLQSRNSYGEIDRTALRPGDRQLPGAHWLSTGAEVLIPAATAGVIDASNCADVKARVVVEGANMPTTPEALELLHRRGVTVIPDFVANGGTTAWHNWVAAGESSGEADDVFPRLEATIGGTVRAVIARAAARGITAREAAVEVIDSRHDTDRDQ
jgi:glutamate dehydrogenase (NAD(P)+)